MKLQTEFKQRNIEKLNKNFNIKIYWENIYS